MESHDSPQTAVDLIWNEDLLSRHGFADFLTTTICAQNEAISLRQERGWTVALDAEWGAGKTFFIERWAKDLRRQGFPVVMFDAWTNDLGDEAVVALMAEISREMESWFPKLPIEQEVKKKAIGFMKEAGMRLRRSVYPATKVLISGILKKGIGSSIEDIMNAGEEQNSSEAESSSEKMSDAVERTLDKVFETALEEHHRRSIAIAQFKESMVKVIDLIHSQATAKIPVFVFVDELDRCRPSYAISLLEEIKHIFGIPNVCFVISTNLSQLTHSVRAVYGLGFDGEQYLKRFFDQAFVLPVPKNKNHIKSLLGYFTVLSSRKHALGLQRNRDNPVDSADAITLIIDAFGLDLRSQKQVFRIADTAVAAIDKEKSIYILWLFFLCALIHRNGEKFKELYSEEHNRNEFTIFLREVRFGNYDVPYLYVQRDFDIRPERRIAKLHDIIFEYYEWQKLDFKKIFELANKDLQYPFTNVQEIAQEMPSSYIPGQLPRASISHYFEIVRYAGFLRPETS